MDASPPSDFKLIESQLFFADSEYCFDGPSPEGDSEQFTKCDAVFSHHGVGEKELHLAGTHVASNDQRLAFTWQMFVGLSPNSEVIDFPNFRLFVCALDSVLLPRLKPEF